MDLPLIEPADMPQPREAVRIRSARVQPYPDGWRVKLTIDVTPFQERPNLEIRVISGLNRVISELSVIETMHAHMEFTLHIRGLTSPLGDYVAEIELFYDDRALLQGHVRLPFSIRTGQAETADYRAEQ